MKNKEAISVFDIEVTDAGPNNYDGGVQVDNVTVTCDDVEYYFELSTPVGGDGEVFIKYEGHDGDPDTEYEFIMHFELEEDITFGPDDDKKGLEDFLQVNDPDCEGDSIELDGFELEITNFIHSGGKEFGWIRADIGDIEFQFDMEQDATSGSMDYELTFLTEEMEEKAKEIGLELTVEIQSYLFDRYDSICAEKRG